MLNQDFKLDWSQVQRPLPFPDNKSTLRDMCIRIGDRFERSVFEFMAENRCTEIYVVEESSQGGGMFRCDWKILTEKPIGNISYRSYKFDRLLAVSDEEFEKMPETETKKYVREWRETMKEKTK